MQRETIGVDGFGILDNISILSLYAEGDAMFYTSFIVPRDFNPLPLCRGRPHNCVFWLASISISILSLYAEGDNYMINKII